MSKNSVLFKNKNIFLTLEKVDMSHRMDDVRVNDGDDKSDRNYTSRLNMAVQMAKKPKKNYLSSLTFAKVMKMLLHME